jgi:hypothetical protein
MRRAPANIFVAGSAKSAVKSGISTLDSPCRADVILHHQTKTTNPKKQAMKTTKIFPVLSLALVLSFAVSASALSTDKKNGQISLNKVINHHVNVTVALEKVLCNVYQVEILNEKGELVAPPQTYVAGVSKYDFYERGPATGIRVAVLVLAPVYSHFSCDTELFTKPSARKGDFEAGQTYRYDLFPQTQIIKE